MTLWAKVVSGWIYPLSGKWRLDRMDRDYFFQDLSVGDNVGVVFVQIWFVSNATVSLILQLDV